MRLTGALLTLLLSLFPTCERPPLDCETRAGGAFITFQVVDDQIRLWITNDAFIDEALALEGQGVQRVPHFQEVVRGTDCDSQWSWHVDPAAVEWVDLTIELCDGTPSYIEENLDAWINEVGSWCPWSAAVIAVDDRRED